MRHFSNKFIRFTTSVSDTDVSFRQILQRLNLPFKLPFQNRKCIKMGKAQMEMITCVTNKEITSREVKQ